MGKLTKRIGCIAVCLLAGPLLLLPTRAAAQAPDLREIIPYLMLVIDTSGSMERQTSCVCQSPACTECLPNCGLTNANAVVNGVNVKKNRWATTLEALTGSFTSFECTALPRTQPNGATYDLGYYMDYHQPWHCATAGAACPYDPTNTTLQQNDGILDQYASRVQFGLMTFDGWDTYVGAFPLVPVVDFNVSVSQAVQGLWSYGPTDTVSGKQGKTFHYPNCTTDYMMDTGARGPSATEGGLVSLNSCSGGAPGSATCPSWCSQCPATQASINKDIQTALLKTRPYGGTPIAASLDDLYFHLKNDLTDAFGSCRNRYALLMTDGYPDDDYRAFGCDCANESPVNCGDPTTNDPNRMHCPYPLPEDVAGDLIHGRTGDKAMIEQLFVVGLAVDDPNVVTRLDAIAHKGCPNSTPCWTDSTQTHEAFFASDINKLVQNLDAVIGGLIKPISRSVPVFSTGANASSTSQLQYQVDSGFEVANQPGVPWTGHLERRRFSCPASVNDGILDPNAGDLFQNTLNAQGTRFLKTAVPSGANLDASLYSGTGAPCGTGGCSNLTLTNLSSLSNPQVGLLSTDTTGFNNLMDWMYGQGSSVRVGKRLADIYHSQPVIVSAPHFDTADESFNLFRQRVDVAARPLMLYVNSNDGILHAFSVENYTPQGAATSYYDAYSAGQELWGFVPPLLLNDIQRNQVQHEMMLDGSPVVKTVYFSRPTTGTDVTGTEYHTVLITGMREGGHAYIALDVTNPKLPKFLWQFTDPSMGNTFGQAAIGQARFMDDITGTGSLAPKQGAVAILPGGVGALGNSGVASECVNGEVQAPLDPTTGTRYYGYAPQPSGAATKITYSRGAPCWQDVGRALYFVDVQTGRLLKKIHKDASGKLVFPSPLVSTPVMFESDTGTLASRAFLTDANGVIWRVDLSAPDQYNTIVGATADKSGDPTQGWLARPFHDIFWEMGPSEGELTYEAPILSVDNSGHLVVIVGTGDNNNFIKPSVKNRVVSLTEGSDKDYDALATGFVAGTPQSYKAAVNWEKMVQTGTGMGLVPSELVTGTMALFDGQLFFGTFIAVTSGNACSLGKGRVHAVDYLVRDPNDSNGTRAGTTTYGPRLLDKVTELGLDADASTAINVSAALAVDNLMVMGLGITERPTCSVLDTQNFNVWGQSTPGISSSSQPAMYLVAQASGDKGTTSLIQNRGGSLDKLGTIELKLKKKPSRSRVVSWATSID
jgi:type IV pilus assembly protein PilY1